MSWLSSLDLRPRSGALANACSRQEGLSLGDAFELFGVGRIFVPSDAAREIDLANRVLHQNTHTLDDDKGFPRKSKGKTLIDP